MTEEHLRRTIIGGIATTMAGLAGCLGGPTGGTTNPSPTTATAFQDVFVDGQSIVIRLASNAELDRVNVIAPNGEQFTSTQVATGAEQVSLRLGTDYQPGDYRVVGVAGESQAAETALSIQPDVQIKRIGVGANHIDKMPEELEYAEQQAILSVTNKGNGPDSLRKLLVLGEVPNPTTDLQDQDSSGIYDSSDGYGTAKEVVVPPNDEKNIFTTTMPFLFGGGEEVDCGKSQQQGTGEVRLTTKLKGSLTQQFKAEYSQQNDSCSSHVLKLI